MNTIEQILRLALQALYNAPVVGEVYDQQHSDTAIHAIVAIEDKLKQLTGNR